MPSALAALLAGKAKAAAVIGAAALASTAGGIAVANVATTGSPHAAPGLSKPADVQDTESDSPDSEDTTPSTDSPVTDVTPTTDVTSTDTASPTDTPTVTNHGTCVSLAAHSTPGPSDSPNAHGKLVSGIARSDCGKTSNGQSGTHGQSGESHGKSGQPHGKSGQPHGNPTASPTETTDSQGADSSPGNSAAGHGHGHGNS